MKPLSEEEIAEGWIAHDGDSCPVDDDAIVEVSLRRIGKATKKDAKRAENWIWSPNTKHPITAYRVVAYPVVDQGEALKPLSEEEIAAGWIAHDGVKCPVGPYRHVDIMWPDRFVGKNHEAGHHQWGQFKDETASIFAYRIVDEDKVLLGEALKGAVEEGVDKLGGEGLPRFHKLGMRYEEQDKAMGDDKPAKDLRQLGRFSHHDTAFTTHVFYDEHPIAMITDDVISWSYHMPDMKKAASEAMHVYLGRVWK